MVLGSADSAHELVVEPQLGEDQVALFSPVGLIGKVASVAIAVGDLLALFSFQE